MQGPESASSTASGHAPSALSGASGRGGGTNPWLLPTADKFGVTLPSGREGGGWGSGREGPTAPSPRLPVAGVSEG